MEDKKFLTYEQQVQKLYDKKLEIPNCQEVIELLKKYS